MAGRRGTGSRRVAIGGDEDVPLLEWPAVRALFAEPGLRARLTVRGASASDRAAAAMLAEIDRRGWVDRPETRA